MKAPTVDYRNLRLSNLTSPEYRHLLLLLGWPVYFLFYYLTETFIPPEACTPIHCRLDDLIPFCEGFLIFYASWYLLIVVSLLYFLLYNVDHFRKLQTYIIIVQAIAMVIYILFPSRQDLRPTVFPRENFLTAVMAFIYDFDTSTGVCPSLHVAYSLGIASTWLREKSASVGVKISVCVLVVLICISVTFVKQHSVLDIIAALPLCLVAEYLVFLRPRRKCKQKEVSSE